jgi:hypothetical protein
MLYPSAKLVLSLPGTPYESRITTAKGPRRKGEVIGEAEEESQ